MPLWSDMNGFPEPGFPVLANESEQTCMGTLYSTPLKANNLMLDIVGNNRLLGSLVIGGAMSGVTTLAIGGALSGATTIGASGTVTLSSATAPLTMSGATALMTMTGENAVFTMPGLNSSLGTVLQRINKGYFNNLILTNRPTVGEDYVALISDLRPMTYPGAGIPISTSSAWGTSITPATGYLRYTGSVFEWKNETYLTALPAHNLIDTTNHAVSGLTTGHFLKATGATSYGFAAHGLTYTDVGAQQSDATLTALAGLTITQGSLIYGTGSDAFSILAKGTAGQVLKMNSGATAPEWGAASSGTVSFGTDYQIPFMKTTDDDFQYSASFTWNGYSLGITDGNGNVMVGFETGRLNPGDNGGFYNTFLGYQAGYNAQVTDFNTFIGYKAGYTNESDGGNVFIGHESGYYETGFDKLFIDNRNRTNENNARISALIYGEFNDTPASQLLRVNGVLDHSLAPNKPKIYTQSTEPNIPNDTMAFWKDSDDSKYYLILDIGGTQKKVELT